MELLFTGENIAAFVTLTFLEVVLGIDNIVFISILAAKLERSKQKAARRVGLILAMVGRIILLLGIAWVMRLTVELFTLPFFEPSDQTIITGRDLVLILGGGFLLYKATHEIHDKLEGSQETLSQPKSSRMGPVLIQIMLMDIIFSLDSVITAVGMVPVPTVDGEKVMWVAITTMVAAIMIAIAVMFFFVGTIARFIERHPTTKMLALAFLFMIGMVLVADGFDQHIPKGYVYSAIVFSIAVEMLNLRMKKARQKKDPATAGASE